jgi:HTH-type transcriptional regulator / antitoxin MqsA
VCGGEARLVRDPMAIHIGQRRADVAAERMRCDSCQAEFFLPGQMQAAQRLAADQMRTEEGLLGISELKGIRGNLGVSQAGLEKMLGVGPKTVVRWERGTVFQNRSTDALLRILRDIPEAATYLANRSGVKLIRRRLADSPSADIEPSWKVQFGLDIETIQGSGPDLAEPTPVDDPKVVSLDDYRAKRPLEPIPPYLLEKARL